MAIGKNMEQCTTFLLKDTAKIIKAESKRQMRSMSAQLAYMIESYIDEHKWEREKD